MNSPFNKKELQEFYDLLVERRAKIIEEITSHKNAFKQGGNLGDLVDMATSLLEEELSFSLTEKERAILEEIDKALERIKNDTYGLCIDTNEPIAKSRLLAIPEALRTLKAQEIYEAKVGKQRKVNSRGISILPSSSSGFDDS